MKLSNARIVVRTALGLFALVMLGIAIVNFPQMATFPALSRVLITLITTAFMVAITVPLLTGEGLLVHLIGMVVVLVGDPLSMIGVVAVGIIVGEIVRANWRSGPSFVEMNWRARIGQMGYNLAQQVLGLLFAIIIYSATGGPYPLREINPVSGVYLLPFFVGYYFVFAAVLWIDSRLQGTTLRQYILVNRGAMLILQWLPAPFAALAAVITLQMDIWGFGALAALMMAMAVVLHNFGEARVTAERRLRELITLNKISRVLRSSLNVNSLLDAVYLQLSTLFSTYDFYMALLEPDAALVSFPVAVESRERAHPPSRPLASGLIDHVLRTGKPVLIERDVRAAADKLGVVVALPAPHSWLGVPIIANEQTMGCLAIVQMEGGDRIPPDALELLSVIADQTSVAFENTRTYQNAQRRANELSTLTNISAALSASLEPTRVLELVCSATIKIFNAQKSAIFLISEDRQHITLAHSVGMTEVYLKQSGKISLSEEKRVRAITTGLPEIIPDIASSDLPPDLRQLTEREGYQAVAEIPLSAPGEIIGSLAVYFSEPHPFSTDELDLLKTFATQAAIAVNNSRMHASTDKALARRIEQLQALDQITRQLGESLDPNHVSSLVLHSALQHTRGTAGALFLMSSTGARQVATLGYPPERSRLEDLNILHTSISTRVMRTGIAALVNDVSKDPDYERVVEGTRSQLSVPIWRDNQVSGVITIESDSLNAFIESDLNFVSQLAAQAGIAIENARLFQRMTENHDQLLAVLNSTRDGILLVNESGDVELVNPRFEELTGLHREVLMKQNLRQLLANADVRLAERLGFDNRTLTELLDNLSQGLAVTAPKHVHLLTSRYIERSSTPVLDEALRVIGWVIMLRDVSDEAEVSQLREELTAMIVHDLRSPMTSVLGSLKLIDDLFTPTDSSGVLSQAVDVSLRASRKLLLLVDSLLDISKLEVGQMQLEQKPIALQTLATSVVSDLVPVANQQGIILINEVPSDLPLVMIDQEKTERLLTNLIDNALKFTPVGGRIIVRALQPGAYDENLDRGYLVGQVIDTGSGIPDEYRERIFDRFVQVRGREGRHRGTGLGLAFCKLVVEAHGGRIWVDNRLEGGSVFSFMLPLARTP